jgi:hypothetical protein
VTCQALTKLAGPWLPRYLFLALIWVFSLDFIMPGLKMYTPFGVAFIRTAFGAV